jgi:hypothetical protein
MREVRLTPWSTIRSDRQPPVSRHARLPQAMADKWTLSSTLVAFVREQAEKKIKIFNLNAL